MDPSLNLSDVYVFKKVAATLSFSKAARQIGVSRSTVSKQISRLEQNLGVILLNRTTRHVNLTEAGRTFDAQTAEVDTAIEHAANLVRGSDLSPNGTVSFTLPSGLGAALMPAFTAEFRRRWPELHLDIHFDDGVRDLISGNLDLAIRISNRLDDSSLISRRLGTTRKVFAASPRYLKRYGTPESLQDLSNHNCLGLGKDTVPTEGWKVQQNGNAVSLATNSLSANNNLAIILAACLDAGIAYLPEVCISGELARKQLQVIPECEDPQEYGIYALYPHRNAAAKVKVLVDFIEDSLPAIASIDRWSALSAS
ncbi:MAG: LysR family transcriptional regulator [Woeseiaceae bacterium]|nr:LysR family transcriptional regulator [Woeseiaceae bacterium]